MVGAAPIAAVIFDLDGTLVDSVPHSLSIINAMLAQRGSARRISYDEALPFASSGGLALIEGLMADDCRDAHEDLAIFRQFCLATPTPAESIYPGVADMVAGLTAQGTRLAICSNKPQHLCEKVLEDLGLAPHFSVVVGSRTDVPAKPAPDMLDVTLARLEAQAHECIFVGDSEVDEALAATRTMDFLFITHGYGNCSANVRPEVRFDTVPDLATFLRDYPSGTIATSDSARVRG
jgi:phosphoglycolate phosphatase